MRYLVIDAALSGTGIRDKYKGGYIDPVDLGLSLTTEQKLNEWLLKYENEHYHGFNDDDLINKLDREGKEIALLIKNKLSEVKIEYFSDVRMTNKMI